MAGFVKPMAEKSAKELDRMLRTDPKWTNMYLSQVPSKLLAEGAIAPEDRALLEILRTPTSAAEFIRTARSIEEIGLRRKQVAIALQRCTALAIEFGYARFQSANQERLQ
jgi:hypothetical protein